MDNSALPEFEARSDGRLTAQMLGAYAVTGVIILRNFAPGDACAALQERALELVAQFDPHRFRSVFSTTKQSQLDDEYFINSGDKIRFFFEDNAFHDSVELGRNKQHYLNKMGHAMHDLDPVFDRFSRTRQIAAVVRDIGFEDPAIIQSMYIFKPPRIGGEVVCHQDSTYIYTKPESCVGFWFALEDATIDNGCLYFVPGGHKGPLRRRNFRRPDGTLVTETIDDTPFPETCLPAEAETGTLVVFHGRAPHRSGPNRSDTSRHAYTLHVIDRRCHYPAENWLQRDAELPLRGFDELR